MRAAVLSALAALAFGCGRGSERHEAAKPPVVPGVETVAAAVASVHDAVRAFGVVAAESEPPDVRDARAQLADAEAKHQLAEQQVRRLEELAQGAVAPRKELEAARADLASTAAAAERARHVLAAFGMNPASAPLGADEGWAIAQVVQSDITRVQARTPARLTCDAYPGRSFDGQVDAAPTYVDPTSRTAPVRVRVKDPEHLLRPGMTGGVTIEVGAAREAVMVPSSAVVRDGTQSLVFVEETDGKYVPRPIELGVSRDGQVEAASGVKSGERVVTTGAASLLSATQLPAGGEEE